MYIKTKQFFVKKNSSLFYKNSEENNHPVVKEKKIKICGFEKKKLRWIIGMYLGPISVIKKND